MLRTPKPPSARTVAVLDFRNLSGRPEANWISTALAEVFRTEFTIGGTLHSVPGEDVARMKRELALPEADGLSKETLARIRRNLQTDLVVLGSDLPVGEKPDGVIRFQITVQDTRTGATIASDSETCTEATLLDAIARAGSSLRRRMGLGEPSGLEALNIKTSLPKSLEAQRLYAEGLNALRRLDAQRAVQSLTEAVQKEPTYALAHSALADASESLGYEAKAAEEAKLAFDLSETLSPEEALLIEAKYRALTQDWGRAIAIYHKLCDYSPRNVDYRLQLSRVQVRSGKATDAFGTLREARILAGAPEDPRIDLAEAVAAESIGDFKREQWGAARAEAAASVTGARVLIAQALLRQCWAYYSLGEAPPAIDKAQQARKIFISSGDRAGEAQALKNMADVIDDQGDHAQGEKLYQEALAIFRVIGYQAGVAVTLNNLAYAFKDQGDLGEAKRCYEESLTVSRQIADTGRQALALNGIGIVLWRQSDLRGARRMFDEALAIDRERGDNSGAATLLNNVGLVLEDEGHLKEAQARLMEALEKHRALGHQGQIARTQGNLGELLLTFGDLAGAKKCFDVQLAIGGAIPEPRQSAYALHGLGEVLLAQGDLAGARAKEAEALALRLKMNEKGLEAESRFALAEVAFESGDEPTALEAVRQATQEFDLESEVDQGSLAYALMAEIYSTQHDAARAQQALDHAAQLAARTSSLAVKLRIGLVRGRLDIREGKRGEAVKQLQFIEQQAGEHGYLTFQLEARLALAQDKIRTGDATAKTELDAIAKEAQSKGLRLVARKAAASDQAVNH
jgi:tetratricopeptide (TPR) repeat protein